ncbi:hypothetical protein PIB30_111383, partial [Stylosanthes scabra]|nr:hypothetical protein [Stylosanthes scabra]
MTHLPTYRRTTSTHMRGRHSASMSSQSCSNKAPSLEDLRICVEVHAYAWKATLVMFWRTKRDSILASPVQSHAYAQNSKHMRGRQAQCPCFPRPT